MAALKDEKELDPCRLNIYLVYLLILLLQLAKKNSKTKIFTQRGDVLLVIVSQQRSSFIKLRHHCTHIEPFCNLREKKSICRVSILIQQMTKGDLRNGRSEAPVLRPQKAAPPFSEMVSELYGPDPPPSAAHHTGLHFKK